MKIGLEPGRKYEVGDRRGFTFIELVIILALLVTLAAVVLSGLSGYEATKLNSAARKLASDLEFARQIAASKQVPSGVTLVANGYTVYEDYAATDLARDPVGGGDFVVDYTDPRYQEFSGVTLSSTLPMNVIQFNSLGIPLDQAGVPFAAQQVITASLGSLAAGVCIVPGTGKVASC